VAWLHIVGGARRYLRGTDGAALSGPRRVGLPAGTAGPDGRDVSGTTAVRSGVSVDLTYGGIVWSSGLATALAGTLERGGAGGSVRTTPKISPQTTHLRRNRPAAG